MADTISTIKISQLSEAYTIPNGDVYIPITFRDDADNLVTNKIKTSTLLSGQSDTLSELKENVETLNDKTNVLVESYSTNDWRIKTTENYFFLYKEEI